MVVCVILEDVPTLVLLPGGEADTEPANAMVNAAVNRVAILFVFITSVIGSGGVPAGMVSWQTLNTALIRS